MQVSLRNKDRVPMIMIGNYIFTYDEPEHELHLDELNSSELNQLAYNWRRGVFNVDNPEELLKLLQKPEEASKKPVVAKKSTSIADYSDEEEQALKSLLNKRVPSIKKEAKGLSPSKLRKLLSLESNSSKPRKSLVEFLDSLVALHKQHVADKVGSDDLQLNKMDYSGLLKQGMDMRLDLDNISDVVESDVEQVVLNPLGGEEDK